MTAAAQRMTCRPRHERLPAYHLAQAIDRLIERADRPAALFSGTLSSSSYYSAGHTIRERLGINDRIHYAWRVGSRPNVSFDLADQVLTRSGLCWWDVWNEDTVRRHAVVVTTYGTTNKATRGRRYKARYRKTISRYGDLGPDFRTLAEIRDLWEPPVEEGMTNNDMLAEFHRVFGGPGTRTDSPDRRRDLHDEEHDELVDALETGDREQIARELADTVYVAYGTALIHGIDLDAAIREVHLANMSKLGDDGKPIRREDGKVLKGPGFQPPNMRPALKAAA